MKTEKAYTEIMNQLEVIHAENLAILRMILLTNEIDEGMITNYTDNWDKVFQNERKHYE